MVRTAQPQDLDKILGLYAAAREFMRANGNPNQWGDSHPPVETLRADIAAGQLYVCEDEKGIYGVFALIYGDDPTYAVIDDGAWRSDTPYATLHRVAGGSGRGVFGECLRYSRAHYDHLRIDTHHDNAPMRHLIEKNGFVYCGIIYVHDDKSPRVAYEWVKE